MRVDQTVGRLRLNAHDKTSHSNQEHQFESKFHKWQSSVQSVSTYVPLLFQISSSDSVHLRRIRLAPNRHHTIELENILESAVVTGRIDCVGCSNEVADSILPPRRTDVVGEAGRLSIDASGISTLALDDLRCGSLIDNTHIEDMLEMTPHGRPF